MTESGADPGERAQILLLRAETLLASGAPESVDEAVLALEGARDAASTSGVDAGLRRTIETRLEWARIRRDGREPEQSTD
jgi:hypothetical protein